MNLVWEAPAKSEARHGGDKVSKGNKVKKRDPLGVGRRRDRLRGPPGDCLVHPERAMPWNDDGGGRMRKCPAFQGEVADITMLLFAVVTWGSGNPKAKETSQSAFSTLTETRNKGIGADENKLKQ